MPLTARSAALRSRLSLRAIDALGSGPSLPECCSLAGGVLLALALAALSAYPTAVSAQPASAAARSLAPLPAAAGPSWSSLSAGQRSALAPLERDWASIDASRKAKWLEIAARFPSMPADEQRRVHERMTEWARMTPAERDRARLSYQAAKGVPSQDRQASWEAYQALPDAERKALAARAAGPSPSASRPAPARQPASSVSRDARPASPPSTSRTSIGPPVAPALVQARPGATTIPMTKSPAPPAHQQPGEPKVAGKPSQVDPATLLPRPGAAAATPGKPASSAAAARR